MNDQQRKRLIDYLPAIYRGPEPESGEFLARLLIPFDRLLLDNTWSPQEPDAYAAELARRDRTGKRDLAHLHLLFDAPLEREVGHLHRLFDANETPEEFLPWLAGWAALSFQPQLSSVKRRKLLSRIIALYRIRGTRRYLQEILVICLNATPAVLDPEMPMMQIGVHSTVAVDTYLGGGAPHFFQVRLVAPEMTAQQLEEEIGLATSIIELAKPAHTYYELDVVSATMQLGVHSTIALDTILGPSSV